MHHALIFSLHTGGHRRPPGPYRIATFLRDEGWDIEVIDWVTWWKIEQLHEISKSRITSNTVFIGFSCFFGHWDNTSEALSKWLKDNYPDIPLVLGGQSIPTMKTENIDYYIHGYGEKAILELAASFVGNTPSEGIKFDPKFKNKKVISAIQDYPSFPMKRLMIKYEKRDFIRPEEWLGLEFSRGCKFKCLYCNFPILGVKGDFTRTAEDFYEQMIDAYEKYGTTNYFCADETFNDYSEKIIKFADAAERLPFDPWITGFIRGDLLVSRKQDWEHLGRLGFLGQYYGIESSNPQTVKLIGKGMDPDKLLSGILEARNYFHTHGQKKYRGEIGLVLGLPYETEESLKKMRDWLIENWQSESFMAWPLEIPYDNTEDVLSGLSLNYEKYGYRESTVPIIPNTDFHQEIKHVKKTLNWENDNLNLRRCQEISMEWAAEAQKFNYNFSINSFNIDMFMSSGRSLENALKLTLRSIYPRVISEEWHFLEKHINKYIENKINYTEVKK